MCKFVVSACSGRDASVVRGEQILISIGTKYLSYCANIARTYLVDPSAEQGEAYKLLMEAQDAAIAALVEGAPMSAAPRAAIDYLTVSPPCISRVIPRHWGRAGCGIGAPMR